MLQVGDPAPDFTLSDDQGGQVSLSALRGRKVVLFFYPKDDTPGCTKEACGFRDAKADYDQAGVLAFGISADSVASHQRFRDKYGLKMPLLSDVGGAVCKAYGVWKNPGISRQTFVVDEAGRILRHYDKVDVSSHAAQILAELA